MKFNSNDSFFDAQAMFVCEQVNLNILDANEAASRILGYTKRQFLKKRILDFGEQLNREELDKSLKQSNNELLDKVWKFKTEEGKHVYFQLSAHLINFKGQPAKLVVAHNVSEIVKGKKSKTNLLSTQLNLDNFPMAEVEFDPAMRVIRWSDKAEKLFGFTEEEAIGDPDLIDKFVYPDDQNYVRNMMQETFREGKSEVSFINRNVTKDGAVKYCEWYNSLLYNDEGEVVAIYSMTHDVTDRENALDYAKRSMMSYQDLFNSISDAIYLIDNQGTILEANTGLERTFGYKRSEVIGQNMRILSAPGKYDEEQVMEIISSSREGRPGKYEGWAKKKNGEIIPTEYLVNPGSYFGEQVKIVVERDISERKQSELALKHREGLFSKLFNTSPIGIALLNEHKEVEMVNDGFEHLFGYREDELKGLELDKLIVPEKGKLEAVKLTESEQVKEAVEKRIRKDGSIVDVIIYAVPVVVEKKVVAIYGIYVDITDRRKAEEDLQKSLHEKEMLLAEVHHRVKNNLAVITGLLELQSFSTNSNTASRILRESQLRVNSIAMVHEKLYQSENFSEVDMGQYIHELSKMIHNMMKRSDLKVNIETEITSVKLPITQAIPCGLILNEILTNSFKHAFEDRNTGEICIQLKQPDEKLILVIKDNGVGIPAEQSSSINESMGMTIIKTLAKQLSADFDYRNENGTLFEFRFLKQKREEAG